ncbi:hypothetical protein [Paenibacillus xylanilyticus]|uniref:hypothetical protein n=1 Tax=Paenibacillus xylanilyticus TaxID=248903 RepID=UPI001FEAA44D|nr:hypothetical protein [Paenibacillus xylanilyticus]
MDIAALLFEHSFYCTKCGNMASSQNLPTWQRASHDVVRYESGGLLRDGECPPPEFTRPEVAEVLIEGMAEQVRS